MVYLFEHHRVPAHLWKSTFGNLIGWNTKENREWVTLEEHAQRHLDLYARYHRKTDLNSYFSIMGRKGREGFIRDMVSQANEGNQNALGSRRCQEDSLARSKWQLGKVRGPYGKRSPHDPVVLREQRWRVAKNGGAAAEESFTFGQLLRG